MSEPRYVCVAMPSNSEADQVEDRIERLQLTGQLGAGRFNRANWHQLLSDRYWPEEIPDLERKLIRACAALSAYTVTLTLNRVVREDGHCALYGDGTRDFRALLLAVKAALANQRIHSPATNKPHISLSYWGAEAYMISGAYRAPTCRSLGRLTSQPPSTACAYAAHQLSGAAQAGVRPAACRGRQVDVANAGRDSNLYPPGPGQNFHPLPVLGNAQSAGLPSTAST